MSDASDQSYHDVVEVHDQSKPTAPPGPPPGPSGGGPAPEKGSTPLVKRRPPPEPRVTEKSDKAAVTAWIDWHDTVKSSTVVLFEWDAAAMEALMPLVGLFEDKTRAACLPRLPQNI